MNKNLGILFKTNAGLQSAYNIRVKKIFFVMLTFYRIVIRWR